MSMISALIDELNKSADEWNNSNMFELARMCREAADTIWQLRDDLQRTNAENAKLRDELAKARDPQRIGGQADPSSFVYAIEQLREFRWQHATNDEDAIPYINNVVAAHERENAKLRDELEDQEGYDQMLRDRLRQQTELCVETEAKNEKLRELAAEMYPCAKAYIQEWLMVGGIDSKSYDWYLRLRELGVEVE